MPVQVNPCRIYSTGAPRVHACTSATTLRAAIEEYERRAPDIAPEDADFAAFLLVCAAECREELALRELPPAPPSEA